jgi:dTMP kinase|tara:strand:- start:658 stop:1275 length:618 start_codon:yes stop_codon:yes gene_type:complete
MYKKLIIVFEGIEGSGKSYHIQNISNYLKKNKIKFIKIREPGGSLNSEKIRKLILNKNSKFNKFTDFLLYMAARNENLNNIIFKNYKKKIILIDRFLDSTIAYQHYGMGVNLKAIKYINDLILKNIKIDFTFLNLVNRKNLNLRLKKRKNLNRYDQFNFNFYSKTQNGFLKLAKNKRNYLIIDSNLPIAFNKKIILHKFIKLIQK